ncbi:MAG: sensor histidine kinase [Erysipelotrichaceae bacterium]|nr:sensor histidine kinase [Erysipelotrichaceae bacterium]
MKRFFRTIIGKALLFIVCIAAAVTLIAGTCAAVYILGNDRSFYSNTEQEIKDSAEQRIAGDPAYDCMNSYLYEGYYSYDGGCRIYQDGTIIYRTQGEEPDSKRRYYFDLAVEKQNEESDPGSTWYHIYDSSEVSAADQNTDYYTVRIVLNESSREVMNIRASEYIIDLLWQIRYAVYGIIPAALIIMIFCFIELMKAAGHRPDTEDIYPGPLYKVPFDLITVVSLIFGILALAVIMNISRGIDLYEFTGAGAVGILGLIVGIGLCMSAAVRIKLHTFIENNICWMILMILWKWCLKFWELLKKLFRFNMELLGNLPLMWKTCVFLAVICFLEAVVIVVTRRSVEFEILLFLMEKMLLVPAVLYFVLCLQRLKRGGTALAEGDLSYQTDIKGLFWELKEHADDLNRIAGGMAIAVEDRIKSERMKTELITNVSHDIKTPLTSIINYASLISEEECENEKITEYSEVLVRQSEKLKRLIEDLVEASKASTGNLDVILTPCDASVFLAQASGEYEEKLDQAELTLVTKQPDKKIMIMADGRRMWRIFDNLMNNICKYAQPGTRVYLSLEESDGQAVISFKNTSREELDMSEEELMERFTRGDSSRNTDGNGLGLSIARSMAELQNGTLNISIDGDLFKAVLRFPVIRQQV